MNRRQLLGSSAPGSADPPAVVSPDGWKYFTPQEAATVEAVVDRLIPPDSETPGGRECDCAIFIDRQAALTAGSTAVT
jgi:gluconate 2-dehydrogenase gamma chain